MDVSEVSATEVVNRTFATEKSDRLQRCLTWVQDCKRAVNELRSDVKAAISNREKCCMVLSAAMAACLALESLVYSGKVDSTKEQQLQRLCAKVTSTVDLAGARVKVYGQQTRLQKYCKFFRKQHTIGKFDSVINQLDEHSEKAWQLADNHVMPLRRRGMRASFSQGLQTSSFVRPTDSNVFDSAECAVLTRCRLRRGTRHNGVRCMVFIDPETSMHVGTMGHVWWYIAGAVGGGNLYMHNLATDAVIELEDARREPPVSFMHHDGQGHVWLGHKGGMVRVWSESSLTPVTLPIKCFHAEIRVIATDGAAAWVGSDSGNVKRIELQSNQVTGGGSAKCWLEHTHTFRHQAKRRRSSTVFSSTASAELDDLSRADSARVCKDYTAGEEPAVGTIGVRAHAGPVTAVEAHQNLVFTSGGSPSHPALHQWAQNGMLQHSQKLKDIGVARAIKALCPIVHVRGRVAMTRQRSSMQGLENVDISSLSSVGTQSPMTGSFEAAPSRRHSDWQLLTAHENGQMQVWEASTGMLCPVLRIGTAGPAARCLVVCKSLGILATAHADGKLFVRLLPQLQAGEGPTVTAGEPVQTLSKDPTALVQAHRSGMVSAVGANAGLITCGVFGSIMWWPEAELRSCVKAAGMRLPSEERVRSFTAGKESPRSAMSKVLRRYFTPSSAALAQATLERMHSSGDLQGSVGAADAMSTQPRDSEQGDSRLEPTNGDQAQTVMSDQGTSSSGGRTLKSLSSSVPSAQQFIAQVNRILVEGSARQESDQEMTGKIAHAASASNLPSQTGSVRTSEESARSSSGFAGPASGPLEIAPVLSAPQFQHGGPNSWRAPPPYVPSPRVSADSPRSTPDANIQPQLWQQQPLFTAARLNEHDAQLSAEHQASVLHRSRSLQQQSESQGNLGTLRKSLSVGRGPHTQKEALRALKQIQRSSSGSVAKLPNSLPGSLSDTESGAFARPAGALAEAGTLGRGSGSSTMSGSIFGGSYQWVIEYSDLTFRKVIGEGSIGRVHLGRWQETDVAIKVLGHIPSPATVPVAAPMQSTGHMSAINEGDSEEEEGTDEEFLVSSIDSTIKTLEREVSIMSAIRHPNVVLFMGVCLDPPCTVTEFCARGSMFDVLAKARTSPLLAQQLDWPKRVSMALDAAKGMLQLHSHKPPILHRDLKSPNLLVDKHWRVKIADFNLSRVMEAQAVVSSISANNPRWLAPEVVTDQAYSTAADVYSFGVILWELLTWQLPWADLGPFQIMVAIAERQRRPPIPAQSDLPGGTFPGLPAYLDLMQACWHAEPQERPAFESCIITLRGLLEQAMTVKSQQKAAGQKDASPRQQAGPSPFTTSALGKAPSAPHPLSQPPASDPAPGRVSAPGDVAGLPGGPQQTGSMQPGPVDMQQLQSNLLRPAVHPTARLSSASLQGNGEVQSAYGGHQAAASHTARKQQSDDAPKDANVGYNEHTSRPQLADVRSRDALMALQNQAHDEHGNASAPPRLSSHQQTVASQQSFLDAPSSSTRVPEQQLDERLHTGHQQPALVAAPDRRLLQRPGQDVFSGGLTDEHGTAGKNQSQKPSHQSSHWWQQDCLSSLPEAEQADELSSGHAGAAQQAQPRQSLHRRPRNSIGALHREGSGSSHMSPFAGFAALTKTRTSIDDRGEFRIGQAGHKSHRQSLEQMVSGDRIMKTVPKHIRRSLEAAPGVRKSLESQAPPPASSSGMRNSKDGINAQTAEQASAAWDEERRRSSLDASMQHNQQGLHSKTGVSSTIKEVPSNASSIDDDASDAGPPLEMQRGAADTTAAAQIYGHTDIGSSGLSKFSPFASAGLANAPSFE
ncbi:hypothetical protein WJX77_003342 [Trebouxia sp. C0004]